MKLLLIQLLSTILSVNAEFKSDPTAHIKLEKITLNIPPENPYLGDIVTHEIFDPGDIISVKFSVKKDFPENMKLNVVLLLEEVEITNFEMFLCEAMEEKLNVKPALESGLPVGKFPTGCPVKAGNDYELRKYQIPYVGVPGFPSGKFFVRIVFYEPDKDPCATINIEGSFFHELPGVPKIPGAPDILGIGR